jgi:L-lysine exporter family protein LysE/ArgO
VGFLVLYGISKLRNDDLSLIHFESNRKKICFKAAIISALTFSVVNPHAYLDGIILIGGYSTKYSELDYRLALGLGASFFSLIWFLLLSIGGSLIVPFLHSEKRIRFVMSCAGVLLLVMSVKLGLDVAGWVLEVYPETVALGKRWVK